MIEKIKRFITHDIWHAGLDKYSPVVAFLIRQLRVFIFAIKSIKEDQITIRASALTYYSTISVVPVMAMFVGIAKGFGFQEKLENEIQSALEGQEEVLKWILDFANNFIASIQGGLVASIGLVILVYTVMKVLGNIESSFNAIWQVKKARSFGRKFSDYLSLMIIAPIFIFLASGLNVFIQEFALGTGIFDFLGPVITFLLGFLPFILIWFLFTILYMVMPNTRVHFRWALIAGIIAGTAFQLLQWAYINSQSAFSRYNAIYGAFAALPLFLLWMQISWMIVLTGAEISFAYQNIGNYELESDSDNLSNKIKKILSLLVVHSIVKRFANGEPAANIEEISNQIEIPIRHVNNVLYPLVECNVISEVSSTDDKEARYQPALDINKITISYVLNRLEEIGNSEYDIKDNETFHNLIKIQDDFRTLIEKSDDNKLIKEL